MFRRLVNRIPHWTAIICVLIAGICVAEPLPATVFRNLESGKDQTVVVYGTSVSTVEKGSAWTTAVDEYFAGEYPGQVTFINSAKGGMQSIWGVENLQERVLDRHPDLVFIEFAINDAAAKHGISTNDCENNLDTMVTRLRDQNPVVDIVLQTMNPAWDSPTEPHHKKYATARPELTAYYAVYRRYAHEHDLPLVDNYPTWSAILQQDPERYHEMVPDGIHPTTEASLAVTWPAVGMLFEKARAAADVDDAGRLHVVIIGDSTVSTYKEDNPKRGWGQMISGFFDKGVTFDNRALSGRSTKTFIEQGWWDKVLETLQPGDYVLIQFGHNDSHTPGRPEATDAFGDYQTYLQRYVDDTRSRGAIPILVTPMHRRSFDANGALLSCRINDDGGRDGDLAPYAIAMMQVSSSNRVACVDLFALSGEYMQRIGDDACKGLLAPDDRTHWNEQGAMCMAALVVQGITDSDSALKQYIRQDVDLKAVLSTVH